ncbi:MAG: hypothetical protein AAGA71_01575 [Pseudomonadota bacterium]
MELIVSLFVFGVMIYVVFVAPGQMAAERGRSVGGWIILSLFFPVGTLIALAVLGDTHERYEQRKREGE